MKYATRSAEILLKSLFIEGCKAVYGDYGRWRFDCGLQINDGMANLSITDQASKEINKCHKRAHRTGYSNEYGWAMTVSRITIGDSDIIVAYLPSEGME